MQAWFLSSRIYAGYATTLLNPEPYAFESGFSVQRLVQAQIKQMADRQIDPIADQQHGKAIKRLNLPPGGGASHHPVAYSIPYCYNKLPLAWLPGERLRKNLTATSL